MWHPQVVEFLVS